MKRVRCRLNYCRIREDYHARSTVLMPDLTYMLLKTSKLAQIQENSLERSIAFGLIFILLGELYLSATVGPTKQIEGKINPEMFGTAKAIGLELYSKHIVAFELASAVLLVAAVGVICLAKFSFAPLKRR